MSGAKRFTTDNNPVPLKLKKTEDLPQEIQSLKMKIEAMKSEANEMSQKVEDKISKIKRSEFVKWAEEMERKRLREKMESTKALVLDAKARSTAEADTAVASNRKILSELTAYKNSLGDEAAGLRCAAIKKQLLIKEKNNELLQLEKRRESMMATLSYQRMTYRNQIVKYNSLLDVELGGEQQ